MIPDSPAQAFYQFVTKILHRQQLNHLPRSGNEEDMRNYASYHIGFRLLFI